MSPEGVWLHEPGGGGGGLGPEEGAPMPDPAPAQHQNPLAAVRGGEKAPLLGGRPKGGRTRFGTSGDAEEGRAGGGAGGGAGAPGGPAGEWNGGAWEGAGEKARAGAARRRKWALVALALGGLLVVLLVVLFKGGGGAGLAQRGTCPATVVLSLPTDTAGLYNSTADPELGDIGEALVDIIDEANATVHLSAMYWGLTTWLREGSVNCTAKHINRRDCPADAGFSREQFKRFGAEKGLNLFNALKRAVGRGVRLYVLEGPPLTAAQMDSSESTELARQNPKKVEVRDLDMGQWFGSGIMHMKMVIVDRTHTYLGSANMDWKSLSQVKELGVVTRDCPTLADDAYSLWQHYWTLAGMKGKSVKVFDPETAIERDVPCWSPLNLRGACKSPWRGESYQDKKIKFGNAPNDPVSTVRISCSPAEMCERGRTPDGNILSDTIHSVSDGGHIYLSVMDFLPLSGYRDTGQVYWTALVDALMNSMLNKDAHVKLLISYWDHSFRDYLDLLKPIQELADVVKSTQQTKGTFEIKVFMVPGWNRTYKSNREYPDFTRVAHSKYIVTDKRANIGTSNMLWDYFHSTAGTSFNTDSPYIIDKMTKIFETDWNHEYARPLLQVCADADARNRHDRGER